MPAKSAVSIFPCGRIPKEKKAVGAWQARDGELTGSVFKLTGILTLDLWGPRPCGTSFIEILKSKPAGAHRIA